MPSRLALFWQLIESHRSKYTAAFAAMLCSSIFLYLTPLIPQVIMDGVLSSNPKKASLFVQKAILWMGGREYVLEHLWLPAFMIAILATFAAFATYLKGRWSAQASEGIIRLVRDKLYDHLQHLSSSYFDQAETGDLLQRCTSDVETVRVFLSTQVVEIGRALAMLLVPLPILLLLDVRMTFVAICLMPIIVGFSWIFFFKVQKLFLVKDEAESELTSCIQENLIGIRVVKAFSKQSFEIDKFEKKNLAHREKHYKLYVLLASFWSISDFLCFAQKALVVLAGLYWLSQGSLQIGTFFYFLTAVTLFIWPMRMLGKILTELGKAIVALDRLQEILQQPTESESRSKCSMEVESKNQLPQLSGKISIQNVHFSYNDEQKVLTDFSLELKAGQTLGIIGASGSGKSTLLKLLLRLYDYQSGSIQIDGHELKEIPRKQLRKQIAVVMQEPFLYSKTLGQNVWLSNPQASKEQLLQSTQAAQIHHPIQDFKEKYETMVGERGVTLSGGQRQRLALARALLQEPALLLLDDSLSAIDTETESLILQDLRQRKEQPTTMILAHRLSTLYHADKIIVLEKGQIIQQGNHDQLLQEQGLYRKLWECQNPQPDQNQSLSLKTALL